MKRGAEGGDAWGPSAKRYGKGGSPSAGDKGVPRTRHAFKVLVPDGFVASLLAARGILAAEIQKETGTTLVFSNRGDCFPGTQYRVLGVYAHENSCIHRAFDWILPKIVDLAEEERTNPARDGPDLIGKEPGEYIFRFCVTKRMSSHIIGSGGVNIKKIRNDTGAKVFIDNDTHLGHRLCRIIGTPEQIIPCLEQVDAFVQQDCEEQDFFPGFAGLVNFGEAAANGYVALEPQWASGGRGGDSAGGEGRGVLVPPPKGGPSQGGEGGGGGEPGHGTVQEEVDGLGDIFGGFPPGTPRLHYSVSCELPAEKVDVLIGNSGEYVKYVEEATCTTIDIESTEPDGPRPITIVGNLVNVYTAHAMMLMKLRTTEAEEQEEAERQRRLAEEESEDPAVLKARIQELQAQLAAVASQLANSQ